MYLIYRKTEKGTQNGEHRNMAQIREQEKSPQKELDVLEASNLQETDFKTIVIRMLKELWGKYG